MNPIREISFTVRNAALVTVAVVLGFCAGSALGLPVWLHAIFLLPAIFLFYRLSGERRPPLWKIVGFVVLLSGFVSLLYFGFEHVPEQYFWIFYVLFVLIFSPGSLINWIERRIIRKKNKSEHVVGGNGG
jgi:hypothetical protein